MSNLQLLWFLLIGVLFSGFFFLEGFDYGVGMASRLIAHNSDERSLLFRTIGPHWDGNEVWLITAGGAMFAAFPMWYASLFSGYYILLFFVLAALIFRGVSFEFRAHASSPKVSNFWDWANFCGSLVAPFLLGMMFTSLVRGMPLDKNGDIFANLGNYVNLFSIVGGVAVTLLCLLHGLNYIRLKTLGDMRERAKALAEKLYIVLFVGLVAFAVLLFVSTDFFEKRFVSSLIILIVIVLLSVCATWATYTDKEVLSFIGSGLTLVGVVVLLFNGMFPRVMIGVDDKFSILIKDASATPYTLNLMTWITVSILPIVLIYVGWSYYIFRKRIAMPRVATSK